MDSAGNGSTKLNLIKSGSEAILRPFSTDPNDESSYTGRTEIQDGVLTIYTLRNGGLNSTIGASSNNASNLVFNQKGTNGPTLNYLGNVTATTDRLFTVGPGNGTGTADLSIRNDSSNNETSLTFSNTEDIIFTGNTNHTFNLRGSNTGNNTFMPRIT
ncbi:MAG: hypothetical protein HC841_07685, partial [Verrucomicrobiae bacterium]|nr:hypothetical protein [Verrucomicrobiae bacterium]